MCVVRLCLCCQPLTDRFVETILSLLATVPGKKITSNHFDSSQSKIQLRLVSLCGIGLFLLLLTASVLM